MTAINSGPVGEVGGVRLPLQSLHGYGSVFMYSASTSPGGGNGQSGGGGGEVTLRLREPEDIPEEVLARLEDTATLSISLQGDAVLRLGSASTGNGNLELFDSESGPDLTLSPQTFTSTAEAFINDNSDSLGVPGDNDMGSSEESRTGPGDPGKLGVKKSRPKASSPNRQGPQQCQVCGKVFNNASALTKHKLTHSDERKYVCGICGKAFKRQDHLNGHMLTHRNKKPFECKAEGCGKSYCDARSLRRHTENHHAGSKVNESVSPSSPTTGPHTPNTPGSNPSTPSTPGAPTTQNGHGHTALKQLLASEPTQGSGHKNSSPPGGTNDSLTKHQIELIQQIMQQTQQQQQPANSQQSSTTSGAGISTQTKNGKPSSKSAHSPNGNSTSGNPGSTNTTNSSSKAKIWNQNQQQQQQAQGQQNSQQSQHAQSTQQGQASSPNSCNAGKASPSPTNSSSPGVTPNNNKTTTEAKLVECSLCRRQFKNIPALNGHMRLHGGYFKKDGENRKSEKKETPGPPLQTASVNVRALIEEKIIQKRTTEANAANQSRANLSVFTGQADNATHVIGKSSFAVPAPPPLAASEKIRRLSDSEHFRQPNVTVTHTTVQKQLQEAQTQAQAQALADMILKGTSKMAVKRTTSDPGQRVQLAYPSALQTTANQSQQSNQPQQQQPNPPQPQSQTAVTESFTMTGYSEDGGYFSPSLQDEVFQQVTAVPDSVLLQASQLDSIQFQASSLLQDQSPDQLQDITLEDRFTSQHTVNPDLQALVNSPLPDSLAEFSTYGTQYTESPHTLSTQSPLPSPLTRHDSPSFTYPTPPASQEGLLTGTLPLLSPQEDPEAVRPVSSPLSAAFYTTTLSSAAAVEEALNAVLPEETEGDTDLYGSGSPNPNSPLPSPLSATPAPSPLSSLPPSSVSSPGPTAFSTPGFPVSPHNALQNQMMPNSEDPLLSSTPKDFAANRRKFEFQSYKLITSQNFVDFGLGNGSLAGIVVDNNGEYKLIQTTGLQKTNVLVQSSALNPGLTFRKEIHLASPQIKPNIVNISTQGISLQGQHYHNQIHQQAINPAKFLIQTTNTLKAPFKHKINLPIPVEQIKEELLDEDIFLNPSNVSSPLRQSRKRPRIEGTLTSHPSRLRRACDRHWDSSYTPPPILDPSRLGPGLYARLHHNERESEFSSDDSQGNDGPPPRINIGTRYQASIPPMGCCETERGRGGKETDHLLWDPGIVDGLSNNEVDMYLQFACCASVPGGGRNKEYALHLLHMCKGNIREAMLKLMRPTPILPSQHPLLSYECRDSDRWTSQEMTTFYQGLMEYNKDFNSIARDVNTKTAKQCAQFYYLWKKLCPDEYKRVRARHGRPKIKCERRDLGRDSKDTKELRDAIASVTEMDFSEEKSILHRTLLQTNERESSATLTTSEGELRLFAYDCPDSFSGSVTVTMAGSNIVANKGHATVNTNSQTHISSEQQLPVPTPLHYPCKICGKVFNKVKSRSAHMKSHRPIPSLDSTGPESKKLNNHQQKQSHSQDQSNSSSLVSHGHDYRQKISTTSDIVNPNANNIWHNPTRLRPP
ncbi:mucin-12 isoform X2 [Diachasmimorpha longicaudata]|uniref:mucin-12 isoform X2 n=1 Tax=Diachasmimorpha longicaudata TaxID=58733 RepID=UPI0030B8C750